MRLSDSILALFGFLGVPTGYIPPARPIEQPKFIPSRSFHETLRNAFGEIGSVMRSEIARESALDNEHVRKG